MAYPSRNIQAIRENIKKELNGQYPDREISAMIDFLFEARLKMKKHEAGLKRKEIPVLADQLWFDAAIERLKTGCPVQYITGETTFYGLPVRVNPSVLIPRPETEELVQWMIDTIPHPHPVILDIGTGSGCIALALKKNMPGSQIFATEVDTAALDLASENAKRLDLNIFFIQHDILGESPPEELPDVDIIASNPPYIPESEIGYMESNVTDFEPSGALFVPDENPLLYYESIIDFSHQKLKNAGMLFLEVHEKYGTEVRDLLHAKNFTKVELRKDINGRDRMVKGIHA
jgi:release factor glutamine methyltransferase